MYERNKRNLDRCQSLTVKVDELCKRLDIYKNKHNSDKIDAFVKDIAIKNENVRNAINKLINQKTQIKNVIQKSSPERALDPQMEPIITRFAENVEEAFNNTFDNITSIKSFETSIQGNIDASILLAMTDSLLSSVTQNLNNKTAGLELRKQIERAKKLQKEAYTNKKTGDKSSAIEKTKEAFYTAVSIMPGSATTEFQSQYVKLMEDITGVEELANKDKCEIQKIKTLLNLSKQHAAQANVLYKSSKRKDAEKKLALSSLLITSALNRLLEHIEEHQKEDADKEVKDENEETEECEDCKDK